MISCSVTLSLTHIFSGNDTSDLDSGHPRPSVNPFLVIWSDIFTVELSSAFPSMTPPGAQVKVRSTGTPLTFPNIR
jgi:hypothetical protein